MTLQALLTAANEAYPDSLIERLFDLDDPECGETGEECGDTLALFIGRELIDTFDAESSDACQISEAQRVLNVAIGELTNVEAMIAALPCPEFDRSATIAQHA